MNPTICLNDAKEESWNAKHSEGHRFTPVCVNEAGSDSAVAARIVFA
jgi:hypothetical protein